MNFLVTGLPLLLCFGVCLPQPAGADALTSGQVIQRCEKAYGALQTYQVTVNVTTTSTIMKGNPHVSQTSARIMFARPNKIRAAGVTMFGSQFAYVSNGAATYQKFVGAWEKAKSPEMAIAGATGLSQDAATTIPALLLHTRWGYPFSKATQFRPGVRQASEQGHACYRVTATTPTGSDTCWIDRKTFLLRRFVEDATALINFDERFSGETINEPLPARAFAVPSK